MGVGFLYYKSSGGSIGVGLVSRLGLSDGKALGWYTEGRRFDSPLRLTFPFKKCDVWTPSRDFVQHN